MATVWRPRLIASQDRNDALRLEGPAAGGGTERQPRVRRLDFLSFLQQRYVAAFERYRELAEDYRHSSEGDRGRSLERMLVIYRRRCDVMRRATQWGVVSAMLLILTLIAGALDVVFPSRPWLPPLAAMLAVVGLALVIASASAVLFENRLIGGALDEELADLPKAADLVKKGRRHR